MLPLEFNGILVYQLKDRLQTLPTFLSCLFGNRCGREVRDSNNGTSPDDTAGKLHEQGHITDEQLADMVARDFLSAWLWKYASSPE